MNVCIVGGSGFIGTYLIRRFLSRGHTVSAIGRRAELGAIGNSALDYLSADTTTTGSWQEKIRTSDITINLAGASIFQRWSGPVKELIRSSRVETTRHIVQVIPSDRKYLLINASGVGYYGDRGDDTLDESENAGSDFLARVTCDWEAAAFMAQSATSRVVTARLGVVLGNGGGALAKMLPAFKLFAGGALGNGNQWFPWIHIQDLAAAFLFLIERESVSGPLNLCAPQPVRNREFTKALGKVLRRPTVLRTPAFVLRTILGEFATVLLGSQRAVPAGLTENGFQFKFPDIDTALLDLVDNPSEKE